MEICRSIYRGILALGEERFVDLFLVDSPPFPERYTEWAWMTLEQLHSMDMVGAIGVKNFGIQDIEAMREYAEVWPPHVNQIEASLSPLYYFLILLLH